MSRIVGFTTREGETWSTLSQRAYGQAHRYPEIQKMNPGVPLSYTITAGTDVLLPVEEDTTTTTTNSSNLPPWIR